MESLFGIPIGQLLVTLLVVFALGMAATAFLAWRNPVLFKMAARNLPRRPAQTALIVLGLMLATLLFSASFTTGDTLAHSIRVQALTDIGLVEVEIESERREVSGRTAYFDAATVGRVREALAGAPVDGILPALRETVPAVAADSSRNEPRVDVLGVDPAGLDGFDPIVTASGERLDVAALAANEVYVSQDLAESLRLGVGDRAQLYLRQVPSVVEVRGIYANGGYFIGNLGMLLPLESMQAISQRPGAVSPILVSNRGGIVSGADATDAVLAALEPIANELRLDAQPVKRDALEQADEAGSSFATVFLLFGNFSIMAGVLLIFLIFVMLAAERKRELGIGRAIGMFQGHVVRLFLFEGALYALLASAVGSLLGIVVAFAMVRIIAAALGQLELDIVFNFQWRNVLIAYTLGMATTFLIVLFAAWRVSHLNIVRAVRDIPEPRARPTPLRRLVTRPHRFLVAAFARGYLAVVLGILLTASGLSSTQAGPFMLGTSLVIIGVPLALHHAARLNERIAYTVAGVLLVAWWLLPFDALEGILPDFQQGIEMFILSGVMLVIGAVWAIMYNLDLLLRGIKAVFRRNSRLTPVLQTSIAYPMANRFRTGMTLAMFSLVIFTLLVVGFITAAFSAAFTDVARVTGGFDVRAEASFTNPIPDLRAAVDASGAFDIDDFTVIGAWNGGPASAKQQGSAAEPVDRFVTGINDDYANGVNYGFTLKDSRYATDRDVWRALVTEPDIMVVSAGLVPSRSNFNVGGPEQTFQLEGFYIDDGVLPEVHIEAAAPVGGGTKTFRVIGVLEDGAFYSNSMVTSQASVDALFGQPVPELIYMLRLRPGADPEAIATRLEETFLTSGLRATNLQTEVREIGSANISLNNLLQGFMALGLIVGIAALGVIAARSVVERRQQIGMLRAVGFQRGMVQASFLIESSFIALLGIAIGTALGMALSVNVVNEIGASVAGVRFVVPWWNIVIVVVVAYAASLLTTFLPARQAANVYPAEALRAVE
ncbi:MAG: ABC transporter permease [SAR202 cluster bacterium]|nr:ABC transporter permease [SAR202 cluster bacterium]